MKWSIMLVSMLSISIINWNGNDVEDKKIKSESSKSSQVSKNVKFTPCTTSKSEEDNQVHLKKIIGTVFDNETYRIIPDACITIEEEEIYSNECGYYEIQNPKKEVLTIRIEKEGYQTAVYDNFQPFSNPYEKECSLPLFMSKDTSVSIDYNEWDYWFYKKYRHLVEMYIKEKKSVLQKNLILFRGKANGTVFYDETMSTYKKITVKIEELGLETFVSKQGYFEFCNLPDGTYTFSIYYNNKLQSEYKGYSVDSSLGVTTFSFDMDRCRKIINYGY